LALGPAADRLSVAARPQFPERVLHGFAFEPVRPDRPLSLQRAFGNRLPRVTCRINGNGRYRMGVGMAEKACRRTREASGYSLILGLALGTALGFGVATAPLRAQEA